MICDMPHLDWSIFREAQPSQNYPARKHRALLSGQKWSEHRRKIMQRYTLYALLVVLGPVLVILAGGAPVCSCQQSKSVCVSRSLYTCLLTRPSSNSCSAYAILSHQKGGCGCRRCQPGILLQLRLMLVRHALCRPQHQQQVKGGCCKIWTALQVGTILCISRRLLCCPKKCLVGHMICCSMSETVLWHRVYTYMTSEEFQALHS